VNAARALGGHRVLGAFLALLLAALPLSGRAAEDPAPSPGPRAEAVIRDEVTPFLDANRGAAGAEGLARLRQELRVLAGRIDSRAAELEPEPRLRKSVIRAARDALVAGLAPEGAAKADAEAAVDLAFKEHLKARHEGLERAIMCWCKTENWTRTLAGCAEGCAEEQKGYIREWLEGGFTDEEIIARMVAHPSGGDRVRAVPEATGTNRLGYVAPFAFLAAAACVLLLVLRRFVRPGAGDGGRAAGAEAGAPPDDEDEISRRIERELEEMET
jgi:cytochrome c-type biogenesis protein CcmH/NrfF